MFKKVISSFLMVTVLSILIPMSTQVAAQNNCYYSSRTGRYTCYKKPNFYRRHRKAINIGAGAGIGALVGGLLGGKKWALIGGLAGAGGGALFTHKQKPKNYTRRYYVRRY